MAKHAGLAPIDLESAPLVGVASAKYEDLEDVRYDIALRTAQAYAQAKLPFIIVDASSENTVGDSFRERGAIVVPAERPGLATQYMDGVDFAVQSGASKIVRHEPEKLAMVNFAGHIAQALDRNDILVIGRTEKAMRSLPHTQARTERLAGWLLETHLNFPADALSGGRGYTRRGAEYLAQYDVKRHGNNWLHLYYPVLAAQADGLPVGSIKVDLIHPPEMTAHEEGDPVFDAKRHEQFIMQMESLLPLAGYRAP